MKTIFTIACFFLITTGAFAQSEGAVSPETNPTVNNVPGKEVVLTLKNTSEKPLNIFAGPKEGIRDPKVRAIGGISQNKLYLREGEIVCLLSNDRRPLACAVIKPGMSQLEINTAGTTIVGK